MSLQTCSWIVCVFLTQMAAGTGVQFVMERHPDNYFCGHLQCLADFTHTDHDVSTFVEMTIYDITRVNSELRLASVSTFDPDMYVDTTKSSAVSCIGTISRLEANLTLQLRHDIDCMYGVYKCQLDLVTVSGHSGVLIEIVTPEYNHSYSRIAEVLSHFDRLTELLNSFTILINNQTVQINRLASQSDDQTAQLVNQTAQLNRLRSQSEDQTAQLVNQTGQLNRLTSYSDDQTAQLVNQTTQLNRLTSQLDDQTAQINRLASLSDDNAAQLVDQISHLYNISKQCDLDLIDQKQRHEADENRLKLLQQKLNKVDQRRVRGDVDFYRGWDDYKKGFGTPDTDLWIGNDVIHNLTSQVFIQQSKIERICWIIPPGHAGVVGNEIATIVQMNWQGYHELRVDFIYNGTNYFAQYTNFGVADESSNYRMTIGGYFGNVYDGMQYHNGGSFSTPDRDNDHRSYSCSMRFHGSWWYTDCDSTNLNGAWAKTCIKGIAWHFSPTVYLRPLTFTEMKIRYLDNTIS